MACQCDQYIPLELKREAITDRIQKSQRLKKQLTLLGQTSEHQLWQCPVCGQCWQGSRAWNWGNKEYLFQVPSLELSEWSKNPFMAPDEMLIYSALTRDYFEKNTFSESDQRCQKENCTGKALIHSVMCQQHFLENLQAFGLLPKPSLGRMFAPYSWNNYGKMNTEN